MAVCEEKKILGGTIKIKIFFIILLGSLSLYIKRI